MSWACAEPIAGRARPGMTDLTAEPAALAGFLRRWLRGLWLRPALLRGPSGPPGIHLCVDVTRLGDERWAVDRGVAGLDDTGVELLDLLAHLGRGGELVEAGVELRVVLAELEGGRKDSGDLFPFDQLLDPPVGVVVLAESADRLAGTWQVVEVAAPHGLLDLQVDVLRLLP